VLKERFSGFTREFEETAKLQRSYAVPDARMREELRKELCQSLVPIYTTFYQKYRNTSFSKNPAKYIKYSPEQVVTTIDMFFDTAA
jgi:exocyst complex protein 7